MSRKNPQTRERILAAAKSVLEAGIGEDVRMSDIARAAGISRQALYLHFPTRAALLVETTYYLDRLFDSDGRLAASRAAQAGLDRLDAFIEAWGGYIPDIYGVARALIAVKEKDAAAAEAWDKRMQDMREGCEATIGAMISDGTLNADRSKRQAVDILWTLLSVENWLQLTGKCGWSQQTYVSHMKTMARRLLAASVT